MLTVCKRPRGVRPLEKHGFYFYIVIREKCIAWRAKLFRTENSDLNENSALCALLHVTLICSYIFLIFFFFLILRYLRLFFSKRAR